MTNVTPPQTTHWLGCWKSHPECARVLLKEAVELLRWANAYISVEDQGYLDAVELRAFLAKVKGGGE